MRSVVGRLGSRLKVDHAVVFKEPGRAGIVRLYFQHHAPNGRRTRVTGSYAPAQSCW
jgi:hypothetical protein